MKTKLILLSICIMMSISSFGQQNNKLKSGVYEFLKKNTAIEWDSIMQKTDTSTHNVIKIPMSFGEYFTQRKLIFNTNTDTVIARYFINNYNIMIGVQGIREEYFLNLKKDGNNQYKAKTERIELSIRIIDEDKIEVEVLNGTIKKFVSSGQYFEKAVPLPPEKYTLTFVRALTAEDEKKLKNNTNYEHW